MNIPTKVPSDQHKVAASGTNTTHTISVFNSDSNVSETPDGYPTYLDCSRR